MKQTLKFILSLGDAKMVVLSNEGKNTCYVNCEPRTLDTVPDLHKLANCLLLDR